MIVVVLVFVLVGALVLVEETIRWSLRPEARRLRVIKKIGGRR